MARSELHFEVVSWYKVHRLQRYIDLKRIG